MRGIRSILMQEAALAPRLLGRGEGEWRRVGGVQMWAVWFLLIRHGKYSVVACVG